MHQPSAIRCGAAVVSQHCCGATDYYSAIDYYSDEAPPLFSVHVPTTLRWATPVHRTLLSRRPSRPTDQTSPSRCVTWHALRAPQGAPFLRAIAVLVAQYTMAQQQHRPAAWPSHYIVHGYRRHRIPSHSHATSAAAHFLLVLVESQRPFQPSLCA